VPHGDSSQRDVGRQAGQEQRGGKQSNHGQRIEDLLYRHRR
jgi:hypothetical protein